jgi:hypothetical protein
MNIGDFVCLMRKNLQTTMIYTHVTTKNILGVRRPLDK